MQGVPPPSAPGLDGLSRGSCDARHSYLWPLVRVCSIKNGKSQIEARVAIYDATRELMSEIIFHEEKFTEENLNKANAGKAFKDAVDCAWERRQGVGSMAAGPEDAEDPARGNTQTTRQQHGCNLSGE